MKLIASWTKMIGEKGWVHHWIVRASCPKEAGEYIEDSFEVPRESQIGQTRIFHESVGVRGWKRRGYDVFQYGWTR